MTKTDLKEKAYLTSVVYSPSLRHQGRKSKAGTEGSRNRARMLLAAGSLADLGLASFVIRLCLPAQEMVLPTKDCVLHQLGLLILQICFAIFLLLSLEFFLFFLIYLHFSVVTLF